MALNVSPNLTAQSKKILAAQELSNVVWVVLCLLGIAILSAQLVTTISWKPLRKVEQTLVFAIAGYDWLKCASTCALGGRRLYETAMDLDDVGYQQICNIWLFCVHATDHTVIGLISALSLERFLALACPVWYTGQTIKFRLQLIGLSAAVGVGGAVGMFIGVSSEAVQAVCAISTIPIQAYRSFAEIYQNTIAGTTVLTNLASCAILMIRWRNAKKLKKNMKDFKKSVQFNALKTLSVVVTLFLSTQSISAFGGP